jgi:hypothetical protein
MPQTQNAPEVSDPSGAPEQAGQPGESVPPLRRPCRICRRRTRPLVEIGSSAGWDLCYVCFRGVSNVRRYSSEPAVEAWELRIVEILADAEARCSA